MAEGIGVLIYGQYKDKDVKKAIDDLKKLQAQSTTMSSKMQAVGTQLQSVGKKIGNVGKSMTVGLTLPIVGVGVAATKMAMDFDTSMTKMVSLVGLTRDEVDGMRGDIIDMASQYGKSASEAADAMFFITSAGLRGSDAMETLEASLKGAAIGLGDVQTIADLATSAMNAYGPSVLSAGKATSILRTAVEQGKLESSELAGAMGSVLPVASALGVGFDEAAAAMAAMSRTGTNASEASTQLRGILAEITKETPKGAKALESVGLSYEGLRTEIKEKGLLSTLQTLVGAFDGNTIATSAFFGNVRALTGVMDLMGAGAETTEQIFAELAGTTAADLDPAFAAAAETTGFKLQQSFATLKNSLIEFGDIIAPFVEKFAGAITRLGTAFQNLSPETKNFVVMAAAITAGIGPVLLVVGKLVGAVGGLIKVFAGITIAGSLLAIKVIAVVAVLAAIALAFKWAYENSEPLRKAVDTLIDTFKGVFNIVKNSVLGAFSSMTGEVGKANTVFTIIGNYLKAFFTGYVTYLTGVIKVLGGAFQVAMKIFEIGFTIIKMGANIIKGLLIAAFDILMNKLGPISTALRAVANGVKSAFSAIAGFVRSAFSNVGKAVETFINFAIDAVNFLIRAYNTLARFLPGVSEATEIAEFRFAQMSAATDQAASSANNLANQVGGYAGQIMRFGSTVDAGYTTTVQDATTATTDFGVSLDGVAGNTGSSSTEKAKKSLKELRKEFKETFNTEANKLVEATGNQLKKTFDDATAAYNTFFQKIAGGSALGLDFATAVDTAKEGGTTITSALVDQAKGVEDYGTQMQELLKTNLSQDAFAAVAALNREQGSRLASELLGANGETLIAEINGAVEKVKLVATAVGTGAAEKWYGAGVRSAQDTYEGFKANFGKGGPARKALQNLMDNLANSMKRSTTITVTTIQKEVRQIIDGTAANGGTIRAGELFLVGEKGPELFAPGVTGQVIPNNSISSMMTGGGGGGDGRVATGSTVINLNVNAGMGTQGAEVGRQIVDALKAYERRNGAVYVTA